MSIPATPATPSTRAPGSVALATCSGYPRQGRERQLKWALERYWRQETTVEELLATAATVRAERLATMVAADLDEVPVGDFSLYDQMLDTAWMLGAIPDRFVGIPTDPETDIDTTQARLDRYFAMARGASGVEPLEMTKWFDTNYHYLVPELSADVAFRLDASKILAEVDEAQGLGVSSRPVVVGPVTFLLLSKPAADSDVEPLSLLDRVLPLYAELLDQLAEAGVAWVQLDEPVAVTDLTASELEGLTHAYQVLTSVDRRPKILVGTYFGQLGDAAAVLAASAVDGLAVDFTGPGAANLGVLTGLSGMHDKRLVAGLVSGRNVWCADLTASLSTLGVLLGVSGQVDVAPSCSLMHVPLDVTREGQVDPHLAGWLAFADQKLDEVVTLARGLSHGPEVIADELKINRARLATRSKSVRVVDQRVRTQMAAVTCADLTRRTPYAGRVQGQRDRLKLPALPTTTIGSFPQTSELRRARADVRTGRIDEAAYHDAIQTEIDRVITLQEDIGLDLLVHGEPERNDMVQYFADQLSGVISTEHGWVQSYGSRYVRPPIIVGDISRRAPITVEWSRYAQSRTQRPVKGMLTGPVTMLAWSFVRDDQPLADTALQMALALRQEVLDLERAGIAAIQVDEPALRETLPLRQADRPDYLAWAVDAFRLTTAGVRDDTQIHTHMCYAEFGDITDAIIAMDADVISLEAARSKMEIVAELADIDYPRQVGPGVWDIHSPRVPSSVEIQAGLRLAIAHLPADRIWVNPDCGLKTRRYTEVEPALRNLVDAARTVRAAPAA